MPGEVRPSDESHHEPTAALDWKESYYFQLYDPKVKLAALFYISTYPNIPKRDFLTAFLADGDTDIYLNSKSSGGKIDSLNDGRLRFQLIKPNQHWKIYFDDGQKYVELNFTARFPPFAYDSKQAYKRGVVEQEHYEQACHVNGIIHPAKEIQYEINCYGHRDHSWGLRDYSAIDEWAWVAAQFPRCTIGLIKLRIGTKVETAGFMSTDDRTTRISDVMVETAYEKDGLTPERFNYHFTDESGKKWQLESAKIQTMVYPPRQSKPGYETKIYEIVSRFSLTKYRDIGYGIAEYLKSQQTSQQYID